MLGTFGGVGREIDTAGHEELLNTGVDDTLDLGAMGFVGCVGHGWVVGSLRGTHSETGWTQRGLERLQGRG